MKINLLSFFLLAFAATSVAADITAGDPITWGNLTIIPLKGEDQALDISIVAADRALGGGAAVLTEVGGNLPSDTKTKPDNAVDESLLATMNKLQIYNLSRFYLFFTCGELSLGGMQDRLIAQDIVIPPGAQQMVIPTFCSELDRWFSNSQNPENSGVIIDPQLRMQVLINPLQSYLWELIGGLLKEQKISSITRTYYALYKQILDDETVWQQIEAIQSIPRDPQVLGIMVANGDRFWTMDTFYCHDLLVSYWPKLLLSYQMGARRLPKRSGSFSSTDAEEVLGALASAVKKGIAIEYIPPECDYKKLRVEKKYVGMDFSYRNHLIHTVFFNREP
jgi:hypothetical protein